MMMMLADKSDRSGRATPARTVPGLHLIGLCCYALHYANKVCLMEMVLMLLMMVVLVVMVVVAVMAVMAGLIESQLGL